MCLSTIFGKAKEGATIVVLGKIYQKRKLHTLKEKLALTDYKRSLIDYKRLQKLDIDYKV